MEENVPPFMNAAERRGESINERTGLMQIKMDSGIQDYDADQPDTLGNDRTTIGNFMGLINQWQITVLIIPPILYPDLYNELYQKYDLNGDGDITVVSPQAILMSILLILCLLCLMKGGLISINQCLTPYLVQRDLPTLFNPTSTQEENLVVAWWT